MSKVEWGVRKVKAGIRSEPDTGSDCGGLQEEDWRLAFDHDRVSRGKGVLVCVPYLALTLIAPFSVPCLQIPHRWPTASSILSKASQYDNVNPTSDLWNYVVPAFTTGNYAWTRKKYGSQWDWKVRSTSQIEYYCTVWLT